MAGWELIPELTFRQPPSLSGKCCLSLPGFPVKSFPCSKSLFSHLLYYPAPPPPRPAANSPYFQINYLRENALSLTNTASFNYSKIHPTLATTVRTTGLLSPQYSAMAGC